jgi:hypothetical protein
VLIPAIIWMFSHASGVWATVFLIYSIPVGILDNFLRPILISRGVELPLILIIRRRHRRTHRVRRHRTVHRPGDPRRDLLRRSACGSRTNRHQ